MDHTPEHANKTCDPEASTSPGPKTCEIDGPISPVVDRYTVGTLVYTRAGLITLFGWLLWGDFIFNLMENVMPNLVPLILKDHGASNKAIAIIVTTLYSAANAVMNPIISYRSDRYRSRWGRRRPFIVATTPMVVLFLAAIPFGPEILHALSGVGWVSHLLSTSPVTPIVLVIGFLVLGFQIFHMFVASVYYYLIPDVVPDQFLGRFYGMFRVFGSAAGFVFSYFIFGHAETWMRQIFVSIALIYGVCILLMCWRVKEGEYPPPIAEAHGRWWDGIRNYGKECFGISYYWWVFLAYASLGWSGLCNPFGVFFAHNELGLSLDLFGKVNAYTSIVLIVLTYPFGVILDRWGSHRTLIVNMLVIAVSALLMFAMATGKVSYIVWALVRSVPISLAQLALMKWTVEVYPRDRYGQFGSAGALFSSIGGLLFGSLAGVFIDWIGLYRYMLVWQAIFAFVGAVAATVVYRRWQALGGTEHYAAP
jgi:maltose/moltooligosaccharide transporter